MPPAAFGFAARPEGFYRDPSLRGYVFRSSSVVLVGTVASPEAAELLQAGRRLTGKDGSVGSNSYFKKLRGAIPLSCGVSLGKLLGYQLSRQCSGSSARPSARCDPSPVCAVPLLLGSLNMRRGGQGCFLTVGLGGVCAQKSQKFC